MKGLKGSKHCNMTLNQIEIGTDKSCKLVATNETKKNEKKKKTYMFTKLES